MAQRMQGVVKTGGLLAVGVVVGVGIASGFALGRSQPVVSAEPASAFGRGVEEPTSASTDLGAAAPGAGAAPPAATAAPQQPSDGTAQPAPESGPAVGKDADQVPAVTAAPRSPDGAAASRPPRSPGGAERPVAPEPRAKAQAIPDLGWPSAEDPDPTAGGASPGPSARAGQSPTRQEGRQAPSEAVEPSGSSGSGQPQDARDSAADSFAPGAPPSAANQPAPQRSAPTASASGDPAAPSAVPSPADVPARAQDIPQPLDPTASAAPTGPSSVPSPATVPARAQDIRQSPPPLAPLPTREEEKPVVVAAEPSAPPSTEPSPALTSTPTDTSEGGAPAQAESGQDGTPTPAPTSTPPAPGRGDQNSPDAPQPSPASGWVLLVRSPGENERDGQVDRAPATSSDSGGAARPERLTSDQGTPTPSPTPDTDGVWQSSRETERESTDEQRSQDRPEKGATASSAAHSDRAPSAASQLANSQSPPGAHDAPQEAARGASSPMGQGHASARERQPVESVVPVSPLDQERAAPPTQRENGQEPCPPGQQATSDADAPGDQTSHPETQKSTEPAPGRSDSLEQAAPADPRMTQPDVTSARDEGERGQNKHSPASEGTDEATSSTRSPQDQRRSDSSEEARSAAQGSEHDEGGDGAHNQRDAAKQATSWQHGDDSQSGHDEVRQGEHQGEASQERPPSPKNDEGHHAPDPDQQGGPAPAKGQDESPVVHDGDRDPSQPGGQDRSSGAQGDQAGAASAPQGDRADGGSEGQGADRWRTTLTLAAGEASEPTVS